MKMNFVDSVKKFMFIENKSFREEYKKDCCENVRIEEFRMDAYLQS